MDKREVKPSDTSIWSTAALTSLSYLINKSLLRSSNSWGNSAINMQPISIQSPGESDRNLGFCLEDIL